jgi:hypothetical protein
MTDTDFPGLTTYESHKKWCFNFWYVPSIKTYFWGNWEVEPIAPGIVIVLAFSSLDILGFLVLSVAHSALIFSFALFFFVLFIYSYYKIISEGPGYFPFYWREIVSHPELPLGNECPAGIISSPMQFRWAKRFVAPPRSALMETARRFVLRPDHECCYTSCWIGKRNMKFFILFNLYGFVYLSTFVFICGSFTIGRFRTKKWPLVTLFLAIFSVLALNFALMTGYFGFTSLCNAVRGITEWEIFKEIPVGRFDGGLCRNLEDVCGTRSCQWFCPTSPWKGLTNEDLISHYVSYESLERRSV